MATIAILFRGVLTRAHARAHKHTHKHEPEHEHKRTHARTHMRENDRWFCAVDKTADCVQTVDELLQRADPKRLSLIHI